MLSAEQDNEGFKKKISYFHLYYKKAGYEPRIGKAHFGSKGSFGADPLNLVFQYKYHAAHNGSPKAKIMVVEMLTISMKMANKFIIPKLSPVQLNLKLIRL